MIATPFEYPVISLGPDIYAGVADLEGGENFGVVEHPADLPLPNDRVLERGEVSGLTVIDGAGRQWKILGARRDVSEGPSWLRPFRNLFGGGGRLHLEVEEQPAMSLDELKTRALAAIDAHPDDWRQDEIIAGEAAPPRSEAKMLEEVKAAVRAAGSVRDLMTKVLAVCERQGDLDTQDYRRIASPSGDLEAVASTQECDGVAPLTEIRVVKTSAAARGRPVFAAFGVEGLSMQWVGPNRLVIQADRSDEPNAVAALRVGGFRVMIEVNVAQVGLGRANAADDT